MPSFLGHTEAEKCAAAWLYAAAQHLQGKPLPDCDGDEDAWKVLGVESDYVGHEVEWIKVWFKSLDRN